MRHQNRVKNLRRKKSARESLIISQAKTLLETGKLTTTQSKARVTRQFVETFLAKASKFDSQRELERYVDQAFKSKKFANKYIDQIRDNIAKKDSGFVNIYKLEYRKGDNADMALLKLDTKAKTKADNKKTKSKS